MIVSLAKKLFGTVNDRILKKYSLVVTQINSMEESLKSLSDEDLRAKTTFLKNKLEAGATLHDILPEAFAVVREASRRTIGLRHYDVQLLGGMVLHDGSIAEMKTGEGKTLVATCPVYLNALAGKGVHVVTVNDYLARRDSEWMGRIYKFLGLSVGVIVHGLNDRQRKENYGADITYGTNNEFGFDYLRDNMKFSIDRMVQRPLNFAIVDEVDSILIDEARTPLIISGPSDPSTDKYVVINRIIPGLKAEAHFLIDEKARSVSLTDDGVAEVERLLNLKNLYDAANIEILHHVVQALKAHTLFKRDVDYVVKDGEVQIVDEFTGRILPGRRWSDGLHQAVEAKEGVQIESENQTLASITYQNYFRMYAKLAGMTGTADTEAAEFSKIYNLRVVVVPPNKISRRQDLNDVIYKSLKAKFNAVVEEIKEVHASGRPILVGTVAIEKSEVLSHLLTKAGIRHNVLNAKHHEREADIIAQAGRWKAVTVATNMAGRGTDILLGGNPEFLARAKVDPEADPEGYEKMLTQMRSQCAEEGRKVSEAGGLFVIGTERHESRRIDNQLRGRCARQGDPGQTRFFISLEDDLMRIFGAERIRSLMDTIGMEEDEVIEHKWITRAIEGAQKRVEDHNFEVRKNVLEYDDVMSQQRHTVYALRRKILAGQGLEDNLTDMLDAQVVQMLEMHGPQRGREFDGKELAQIFHDQFGTALDIEGVNLADAEAIGMRMYDTALMQFQEKCTRYTKPLMMQAVRYFMLQTIDELWKDHLLSMDHLRDGIGLRGYGSKDPKQEYKREGFVFFQEMMARYYHETLEKIFKVHIETEKEVEIKQEPVRPVAIQESVGVRPTAPAKPKPVKAAVPAIGRNDPCPCGSGKKYKKCCGAEAVGE